MGYSNMVINNSLQGHVFLGNTVATQLCLKDMTRITRAVLSTRLNEGRRNAEKFNRRMKYVGGPPS